MFSQYCAEPFSYEQVDTVLPDGSRTTSPDMSSRRVTADVPYVQNLSGLKLDAHQMQAILGKMQLSCSVSPDAAQLLVDVPVTRSDVRATAPHLPIPRICRRCPAQCVCRCCMPATWLRMWLSHTATIMYLSACRSLPPSAASSPSTAYQTCCAMSVLQPASRRL